VSGKNRICFDCGGAFTEEEAEAHSCPPKEPQPSQGAGAEEMAEAWIAEQREKRSRWDAMENCYRVDIGIVETWLAGHASGYSKGREEQQKRIAEIKVATEKQVATLQAQLAEAQKAHHAASANYHEERLRNRELEAHLDIVRDGGTMTYKELLAERDTLKAQLEVAVNGHIVRLWGQDAATTISELRAKLAEAQKELETHRALLKDICEQWNEDCDPACDRHAHASGCKSVDIANAKRALQAERDSLRSSLAVATGALENIAGQSKWHINADELRAFKVCEELANSALAAMGKVGGPQEGEK